jgi:hypothetical protein
VSSIYAQKSRLYRFLKITWAYPEKSPILSSGTYSIGTRSSDHARNCNGKYSTYGFAGSMCVLVCCCTCFRGRFSSSVAGNSQSRFLISSIKAKMTMIIMPSDSLTISDKDLCAKRTLFSPDHAPPRRAPPQRRIVLSLGITHRFIIQQTN